MQSQIQSVLNELSRSPLANAGFLQSVQLAVGDNTINHGLGRKLQGWSIVRMRGVFSQVYDKQDQNQNQALTLVLNSSAAVTVDLIVF